MALLAVVFRWCFIAFLSAGAWGVHAQMPLQLSNQSVKLTDAGLWYRLSNVSSDFASDWTPSLDQAELMTGSILGRSGRFVASIPLTNQEARTWFVIPNTNFMDQGVAYWQPDHGVAKKIADFSQQRGQSIPSLLHAQTFPLNLPANASGRLWIVISAQHYPTPVPLSFDTQSEFYHYKSVINAVTISAVVVMLTLAIIALVISLRVRLGLPFWCAGYVGLHGVGWAVASGLVNDLVPSIPVNLTYGGMYIFPFAIACAAMFSKGLFSPLLSERKLGKALQYFATASFVLGVILAFVPFQTTFYVSHIIAMVWVPLSLYIGITMLSKQDFRAKYYLVGNLLYSMSLMYYVASHGNVFAHLLYPELVVLAALALDCICIMLSLSEWLQLKQREYLKVMFEARIDPLTQVGNRFALNEALESVDKDYCMVFIDFDGVKQINDGQGHKAGDQFLMDAADLMRRHAPAADQVFRSGGDEFVWLIGGDDVSNDTLASELEQRILDTEVALRKHWPTAGISYGIAHKHTGKSPIDCLATADKRMYQHKASKREPSLNDSL